MVRRALHAAALASSWVGSTLTAPHQHGSPSGDSHAAHLGAARDSGTTCAAAIAFQARLPPELPCPPAAVSLRQQFPPAPASGHCMDYAVSEKLGQSTQKLHLSAWVTYRQRGCRQSGSAPGQAACLSYADSPCLTGSVDDSCGPPASLACRRILARKLEG